jgi:hypothetical protein
MAGNTIAFASAVEGIKTSRDLPAAHTGFGAGIDRESCRRFPKLFVDRAASSNARTLTKIIRRNCAKFACQFREIGIHGNGTAAGSWWQRDQAAKFRAH